MCWGNWLNQLRKANSTQCKLHIPFYLIPFTVIQTCCKTATGYLNVWLTCLYKTLASSPLPSQITRTPFLICIHSMWVQFCVMPRILLDSLNLCIQHKARKKVISSFFRHVFVLSNSMWTDKRQSVQVCSPHTVKQTCISILQVYRPIHIANLYLCL